jgi:hypothetical protein
MYTYIYLRSYVRRAIFYILELLECNQFFVTVDNAKSLFLLDSLCSAYIRASFFIFVEPCSPFNQELILRLRCKILQRNK